MPDVPVTHPERTTMVDNLAHKYKGSASAAFWEEVHDLPDPAYELACILQNVETDILDRIRRIRAEAEAASNAR